MILYKRMLPKTNVVTLAELLAGFGSKLGELTTAVFVTDAGTGGIEIRTVKLTVAEAPLAMGDPGSRTGVPSPEIGKA